MDDYDYPVFDCSKLDKYIGRTYDMNLKTEIEEEFEPYTVMLCNEGDYYCEVYYNSQIRCLVTNDGKISCLSFN